MSPDEQIQNGWSEYERLVMYRLDTLDAAIKNLTEKQAVTHTEVTTLQAKASMWGALAGFASGFIGIFIKDKTGPS